MTVNSNQIVIRLPTEEDTAEWTLMDTLTVGYLSRLQSTADQQGEEGDEAEFNGFEGDDGIWSATLGIGSDDTQGGCGGARLRRRQRRQSGKRPKTALNKSLSGSRITMLNRPLLTPGLTLGKEAANAVESLTPAPGYYLLAPRLGERGILEWRRRLLLHQQQQHQQQQHQQKPSRGGGGKTAATCDDQTLLVVSGECFCPRTTFRESPGVVKSTRRPLRQQPQGQQLPPRSKELRAQKKVRSRSAPIQPTQLELPLPASGTGSSLMASNNNNSRPGTAAAYIRPSPANIHHQQQLPQSASRRPPLQNGSKSQRGSGNASHHLQQQQQQQQQQQLHHYQNRPRFSPYTPPLSSSVPISAGSGRRTRHATVSNDADINDPGIYPTELSSSRGQREAQAIAMSRSYDCTFFSGGAAAKGHGKRGEFVIHPEWLSESVSIERLRITERPFIMPAGHQQPQLQHQMSLPADWPRRCKSAPPPPQVLQLQQQHSQQQLPHHLQQHPNPITWQ